MHVNICITCSTILKVGNARKLVSNLINGMCRLFMLKSFTTSENITPSILDLNIIDTRKE